jgi:hypothetical protein
LQRRLERDAGLASTVIPITQPVPAPHIYTICGDVAAVHHHR